MLQELYISQKSSKETSIRIKNKFIAKRVSSFVKFRRIAIIITFKLIQDIMHSPFH